MNYVSGQKGRVVESNIRYLEKEKYMGFRTFLRTGALFDMDLLFDRMPRQIHPFDFQSFFESEGSFEISTVNCNTGETVYYNTFRNEEHFLKVCRAANSLPLISPIVEVDGQPMLDGGMADAIPIMRALQKGWNKIVVVLTREEGYRKSTKELYARAIKKVYAGYPAFVKTMEERAGKYNAALSKIRELEQEGRVFVIRPKKMKVANNECNVRKLFECYEHGKEMALERLEELKKFLEL